MTTEYSNPTARKHDIGRLTKEMYMKKQLAIAGLVAGIATAGVTGVGIANAATTSTSTTNPMSSLVDALATKFNLNKTEVQAVFDAQRTQMEANREAEIKKEVAQLVTDGKITQAQADKINAKRAEMQKEREANKDTATTKTREEMKTEMQTRKSELEQWAKDNGISTDYLRYVMGGGHGHGGPGFGGERPDSSSSSSSSSNTTN